MRNKCDPLSRPTSALSVQLQVSVLKLLDNCWSEIPAERPDITTIRNEFEKATRTKNYTSSTFVDRMLSRLESYSEFLEEEVVNRTEQLVEEKRKCDNLLLEILPR